jgi:hypothetical protein
MEPLYLLDLVNVPSKNSKNSTLVFAPDRSGDRRGGHGIGNPRQSPAGTGIRQFTVCVGRLDWSDSGRHEQRICLRRLDLRSLHRWTGAGGIIAFFWSVDFSHRLGEPAHSFRNRESGPRPSLGPLSSGNHSARTTCVRAQWCATGHVTTGSGRYEPSRSADRTDDRPVDGGKPGRNLGDGVLSTFVARKPLAGRMAWRHTGRTWDLVACERDLDKPPHLADRSGLLLSSGSDRPPSD